MFVQLQFDQEARRAMILQIGIYAVSLLFHGISWYFWKKEIQCLINLLLSMKCNWKNSTISLSNIILFGGFWCSKTGVSIGSGVDLKHGLLDTEEDITGCVTEFCGDSLSSLLLMSLIMLKTSPAKYSFPLTSVYLVRKWRISSFSISLLSMHILTKHNLYVSG